MTMNYTLKEIAKELGVSRATIDRVIHNRGGIGRETVEKVTEFLNSVNYKPNRVGKSLAKRHNKNIYVMFHAVNNEFFDDVRRGVQAAEDVIKDFGFKIRIVEVNRNSEEQLRLLREIVDLEPDAIALSSYEPDKFVEMVDECYKRGIPVVTFNNDIVNSSRLCYVGINYYKNGRMAGEVLGKLVKSGNVAILRHTSNYWQTKLRITGFSEEIEDSFPDIRIVGSFKDFIDYDSSYINMKELMESTSNLKGVFLINNEKDIIRGICNAISDFAHNKIDIVTLDLIAECTKEIKNGRITASICQDPFSQGYYSVRILFKYLFDNELPKKTIFTTRFDVIYKENIDNYNIDLYGL